MVLLQELGLILDLIFDTAHQIIDILFWRYIFRIGRVGVLVTPWKVDLNLFILDLLLKFEVDSIRRAQVDLFLGFVVLRVRESKWLFVIVDTICGHKPTPHGINIFLFVAIGGMIFRVSMRIGLNRNRSLLSFYWWNFEMTFHLTDFFSYFKKSYYDSNKLKIGQKE
jgi:hypothetical protein